MTNGVRGTQNPFYVQPGGDMTPGLAGLGQVIGGIRQQREAEQSEREKRDIQARTAKAIQSGDVMQIIEATKYNPDLQKQALASFGVTNPLSGEVAVSTYKRAISDPENAIQHLMRGTEDVQAAGGQPTMMMRDIELLKENPEAGMKNIRAGYAAATGDASLFQETPTPGGEIIKSSEISDGFIVRQKPDGTFTKTKVLETSRTTDAGKASAVTKIFDNGTVIQALPNGGVTVKDPAGNVVTGDARLSALRSARNEEIAFGRTEAAAKAAGTASIRQSEKHFEKLGGIKIAVSNIDKAIEAIDAGAETGPIVSKLPSIQESSIKLDNIQKAMGLDVIGTATFGALSKGELDLALSKAIPTGLKPQALRRWLVDKKQAQEKMATYIEDAAIFLGTPGNTISGWLEAQEAISEGSFEAGGGGTNGGEGVAPPAAIEFLRNNPATANEFKENFGYLPEAL